MPRQLMPCPSCSRHVVTGAARCPFCDGALPQLRRRALGALAAAMGLAVAGCPARPAPKYGMPPQPGPSPQTPPPPPEPEDTAEPPQPPPEDEEPPPAKAMYGMPPEPESENRR